MSSGVSEWASEQTNERSGARKRSEQCALAEQQTSRFQKVSNHCGAVIFLCKVGTHWNANDGCFANLSSEIATG